MLTTIVFCFIILYQTDLDSTYLNLKSNILSIWAPFIILFLPRIILFLYLGLENPQTPGFTLLGAKQTWLAWVDKRERTLIHLPTLQVKKRETS